MALDHDVVRIAHIAPNHRIIVPRRSSWSLADDRPSAGPRSSSEVDVPYQANMANALRANSETITACTFAPFLMSIGAPWALECDIPCTEFRGEERMRREFKWHLGDALR
jgi:hypothetical protein